MIPPEEQRHLADGPRPGETPGAGGTISVMACGGADAGVVLDGCRAVMSAVLKNSGAGWPSEEEWVSILPGWFVGACGLEMPREDTERWLAWWRTLEPADRERAEREERWTLADWLYWLEPSERQWFWWGAEIRPDGCLRVTVEVPGRPAALGALDWLLRAAGAGEVVHEEDPTV